MLLVFVCCGGAVLVVEVDVEDVDVEEGVGVLVGNVKVGLADAILQNLCARSSAEVNSVGQSLLMQV